MTVSSPSSRPSAVAFAHRDLLAHIVVELRLEFVGRGWPGPGGLELARQRSDLPRVT